MNRKPISPSSLAGLSAEQQRELLQKLLQSKSDQSKCFAMSEQQKGLWYGYRRDPKSTAFNVFLPSRIRSPLDLNALQQSLDFLVQRHPCLRTTFSDADQQLQQTVHESLPPEFQSVSATNWSDAQIREHAIKQTQRPFDLESGPLLRMAVYCVSENDFVVLAVTHHIVVDFWSLILILSELRQAYPCFATAKQPTLPAASENYRQFVQTQQKLIDGERADQLWNYWQQTLGGASTVLDWTTDYARPANFSGQADVASLPIPRDVTSKINAVAKRSKTTPSTIVLAALEVFISRMTRQDDFLIGAPFSGRSQHEFESTVGFFVNMLPLRANLTDNPSFIKLAQRVGETVVSALEHESLPFAEIVRRMSPPRDASRSPLFQASCTFEKAHVQEESGSAGLLLPGETAAKDFGGLQLESFYVPHRTCHYDMEFIFEQTDDDLRGMICYCCDLFSAESIRVMAQHFADLLNQLVNQPETPIADLAWHTDRPVSSIGADTNDSETLHDVLKLEGDGVAIRDGATELTYAQLRRRAHAIASGIIELGIGNGDLVPVVASRGADAVAAILGVIFSGATVVPIDIDQPALSMDDLIKDTDCKWILVDDCEHEYARGFDRCVSINELTQRREQCSAKVQTDDLAYVIYTSGSTGRPKGVMVSNSAICNTIQWRQSNVPVTADDRIVILLSHQFDAGLGIVLSSLAQGATLVWPDNKQAPDATALIEQISRDSITVLPVVPTLLRLLVIHPRFGECRGLHQVWCGGETLPADLTQLVWQKCSARIWNFYGPTEAAVEATAYEVRPADGRQPIPIGNAIANTEVRILDSQLKSVPSIVPGQIAIAGAGLAKGYWKDSQLTKQKFVLIDDADGMLSRFYLTGDLGRRRADGQIEFLGRMDSQVKLRGYRIELEEIDSVLRQHRGIANAAAKVINESTAAAQIAAFVVPSAGADSDCLLDQLRRFVAERLPAFKRPAAWKIVDELPVGSSGKVNRRLLPEITAAADDDVGPSTPLEQYLADAWSEMLEVAGVGVNQDFFQLGGSSLQAAMMTTQLSSDLGVHVPTALLFDLADVARLAQRLVQLHEAEIADRFGIESVTAYAGSNAGSFDSDFSSGDAARSHPLLAALKTDGSRTPMFMVHPPGGIVICYRELAEQLHAHQPLYAIRSRGLHGSEALPSTVEEMAADYVSAIKSAQPSGPYTIGGWSLGGVIAYEISQQLIAAGDDVHRLVLLDSTIPEGSTDLVEAADESKVGLEYGIDMSLDALSNLNPDDQLPFLWNHAVQLGVLNDDTPKAVVDQVLKDLQSLFHHHVQLTNAYRMKPTSAKILLIRPSDVPFQVETNRDRGWSKLASDVQVEFIGGHHHSMVQMPHVSELAGLLDTSNLP